MMLSIILVSTSRPLDWTRYVYWSAVPSLPPSQSLTTHLVGRSRKEINWFSVLEHDDEINMFVLNLTMKV